MVNELRVYERYALASHAGSLRVTCEKALTLFTGGQVAQEAGTVGYPAVCWIEIAGPQRGSRLRSIGAAAASLSNPYRCVICSRYGHRRGLPDCLQKRRVAN